MSAERDVEWEAVYADGSRAILTVDRDTLHAGEDVVRIIAGERQRAGRLPAGHIRSLWPLAGSAVILKFPQRRR